MLYLYLVALIVASSALIVVLTRPARPAALSLPTSAPPPGASVAVGVAGVPVQGEPPL